MVDTFLGSLTVVELGSRVGVAAAANLLAQLGATVVAVETDSEPSKGKWANRAFAVAGKKSTDLARGCLRELIAVADVLLLSTDVDPQDRPLWDNAPGKVIVCDLTAFGHSGPLAGCPLSEGLVEAMCGTLDTTGVPQDPPTPIGTPLLDLHAGLYAAGAVIAALRMRRLQGFAERIDVALFDVGTTALVNFVPLCLVGKPSTRSGNRHPLYVPWGTYDALDGTLLICSVTDQQWKMVCQVMQRPDLATDPRFATSPARLENFKALEHYVSQWIATRRVGDCESLFTERAIPAGRVMKISQLPDDINIQHRRSIIKIPNLSDGSELSIAASPFRAAPISGLSACALPAKGSDNQFIQQIVARQSIGNADYQGRLDKPFSGIRVIEIGQYTVAPLASRVMGALGADVIKVESPMGDAIRTAAPLRSDGAAYIFALSNTDKRGIVLDLRQQSDRDTLHRLLGTADILLENLKPGSLARQGFDKETLRHRHPRLIYCAVNGFGTDSAYPGRPALDTVIQAMSGLMDVTRPNGEPIKAGISASDNLGGQFAFVAISAALELRDRTGVAVHFDLSMQDATLWATQLEWNGSRSRRPTIIKASDGYVAIEPDAAKHVTSAHSTRSEIVAALPANSAAPVLPVVEVMNHPQTKARNLFVECPMPEGDSWLVFSLPFKMSRADIRVSRVMGPLGSTDAEILAEIKGASQAAPVHPSDATGGQ